MDIKTIIKSFILSYIILSVYYSEQNVFRESSADIVVPSGTSKEICINNSSVFTDMWNERYLHIDSSHSEYTLYSKKTIILSLLNDKHVSDLIIKESGRAPYSVDVRMYFSRCYIIQNDNQEGKDLIIRVYTYRVFCKVNAIVMIFLTYVILFHPKQFIMHVCYYGASVLTCLVSITTYLSYYEGKILNLPGVAVIKQTFYHAIPVILFYTFFLVHILSFLLRILLNYYHISINDFNHIPYIISFAGPYICKYQYWIVGLYVVTIIMSTPFNKDGIWIISTCGIALVGMLLVYGKESAVEYLLSGIIISVLFMTIIPFLWRNGYFYFLFPRDDFKRKKEVERNLKTVIDE